MNDALHLVFSDRVEVALADQCCELLSDRNQRASRAVGTASEVEEFEVVKGGSAGKS